MLVYVQPFAGTRTKLCDFYINSILQSPSKWSFNECFLIKILSSFPSHLSWPHNLTVSLSEQFCATCINQSGPLRVGISNHLPASSLIISCLLYRFVLCVIYTTINPYPGNMHSILHVNNAMYMNIALSQYILRYSLIWYTSYTSNRTLFSWAVMEIRTQVTRES